MIIDYYSLRRVNPYLGVIQVIDTGAVRTYSTTGQRWQSRRVSDSERFWSDRAAATPATAEISRQALHRAVAERPALPFPAGDRYELWLLAKDTRLPLALLRTARWPEEMEEVADPVWRPFMPGEHGFDRRDGAGGAPGPGADQDRLHLLVNYAARPMPCAQWFERTAQGGGIGHGGLRVEASMERRHLPASAFPELLVSECWTRAEDAALVADFHDWNAALLLAHQGIGSGTRERLERAAAKYPARLLDTYPVLPQVLDESRLKVAMVQSRLMRSA
ncbi:MAG TPA: hypothetical protein VKA14_09895 [Gammaproteobacteria bacterium]|nr:hypothetical protein [Gammaproteobacteria bacterium]